MTAREKFKTAYARARRAKRASAAYDFNTPKAYEAQRAAADLYLVKQGKI